MHSIPRENSLVFRADFPVRDIRHAHNYLEHLIVFRGYEDITLDFRELRSCFPDAILPIISIILKYREDGVKFNVLPPTMNALARTFESANWLHLMAPEVYKSGTDDRMDRFPARVFRDSAEQHVTVNTIIDRILRTTTFLSRDHLRGLEWSLNEITDNVLIHSENSSPGVIQMTHKPKAKEIEFVVCDSGIGIPQSLRQGLNQTWSDEKALEESVKEGVTRGTGQGNGLFGSIRIAEASGGAFSINSGMAYLALTRDGVVKIKPENSPWPGTTVDCSFSYSRALVLEKALSFKTGSHIPLDLIDFCYEDEDGVIPFLLAAETTSIGSRQAGFEARKKLENIATMSEPSRLAIDCADISLMSSSFADEFFAKLIEKLGAKTFTEKFIITGLNETNINIISRSLFQRTGLSFIDILTEMGH